MEERVVFDKAAYTFTYKVDMPDFSVVEVETNITEADFDQLHDGAEIVLFKERVAKPPKMIGDDGEAWDIDMFFSAELHEGNLNPYCILAECELYGERRVPSKLPGVVSRNLLHEVRPGDKAFSSRSLANEEKTSQIMRVLIDMDDARKG